ncbi:hypothetical protein U14_01272 [Candidatus Moduliflexus flocculans]|uniref:Flavinylation-associated cytochrome domain-containing protein n=1 Tax=Candidatus Moduliflexus flocculans TaxID=1499966 RepID=A0A0S6VVX3_9BACT|nr:hypothetical protein U14_01272 [Candidatus Moduliflexus flocculans]
MKRSYLKLLIDIVMAVAVIMLMEPHVTGLRAHELGGLLIFVVFLVHALLNWKWIACMTGQFFTKLPMKSRVNYCLDALLAMGFFLIALSGMAIAKTIDFTWLPLPGNMMFWRMLHGSAALLTFTAAGIHVGLHWKWVLCHCKKRNQEVVHA